MNRLICSTLLALLAVLVLSPVARAGMSAEDQQALLQELDERQRSSGDFKALTYIESKQRDKADLVYQAVVYRRDAADKLVILFLKPQSEAGKGYLRVDKNLFLYDPTVGRWERRTERERIGGTGSSRADFDESRLADEYTSTYVGEETLGRFTVHHLKLTAREGVDVAFPIVELWVDKDTHNLMKAQDFALSGRLMRTTYYPEWMRTFSESKGQDVWWPKEIRIFDEIEEGTSTTIVMQEVDLAPLDDSIFTKAWLESKSR